MMLDRRSEWRRWEPHIHAPGTVMTNQLSGSNGWRDYVTALEQVPSIIEAIAVADSDAQRFVGRTAGS
jgi:hypothetical protein